MMKIIKLLIISLIFTFSAHAAGSKNLKVAYFPLKPLFFKDDSGMIRGFNDDLLQQIAKQNNWKIQYVHNSWNDGLQAAKNGEIDLLTTTIYTKERDEYLDYSKESFFNVWGELYALPKSDIHDLFSLQNTTVAITKGDMNGRNFQNLVAKFDIHCDYLVLPSHNDVLEAVENKKAIVGVVPNIYGLTSEKSKHLIKTPILFNPNPVYFSVPDGTNEHILYEIDRTLKAWKKDKQSPYYQALNRWMHLAPPSLTPLPKWIKYTFAIGTGVLLFLLLMSRALSIAVTKKTKELNDYQNILEEKVKERTEDLEKSKLKAISMLNDIKAQQKIVESKNKELEEMHEQLMNEIQQKEMYERTIFEQKKFMDMGQMINAIAHQWRQPLNNLSLTSQAMSDIHNGEDYDIEYDYLMEKHNELVKHMSTTIDDFRNFFSPNKQKEWYSIVKQILTTADLIKPQLKHNGILLEFKCSCSKHSIQCDDEFSSYYCDLDQDRIYGYPNEFKQVFLNIISNAKDAILEASEDGIGLPKKIKINVTVYRNIYTINIFNYGKQIPDNVMLNIFDPYFTTKGEGKGTGIGLYMSKLIIENNMNGKLTCQNEEDGVSFTIKFQF
jgi:signal transduction histidine kinase